MLASVPQQSRRSIRHTINPWVTDHDGTLRQLQLGNGRLDALVLEDYTFHHHDFLPIGIGVDIGAQPGIVLDLLLGQVDDSFMKFVLSPKLANRTPPTHC